VGDYVELAGSQRFIRRAASRAHSGLPWAFHYSTQSSSEIGAQS
jgi:hypothetical protein